MIGIVVSFCVLVLIFVLLSMVIPGFKLDGFGSAIQAAIIYCLVINLAWILLVTPMQGAVAAFAETLKFWRVVSTAKAALGLSYLVVGTAFNLLLSFIGLVVCSKQVSGLTITSNGVGILATFVIAFSTAAAQVIMVILFKS